MSSSRSSSPKIQTSSTCPACGHHVAVPFIDPETQPLATVAWPKSTDEAKSMTPLPLTFVRCVSCGHVYNADFTYENVPYSEKPNLMFNRGSGWGKHIERVCNLIVDYLPPNPTIVEIGCGEGHLLRALASKIDNARLIGFDPNASMITDGLFEGRAELFVPDVHVETYEPDLIISRHVLEHLVNPLGFLQSIEFAAAMHGIQTRVFIEVPCIDRVFESGRIVDFYYEHNSHFTTESFTRMLHRTSESIELLVHSYNREVITGLVRVGVNPQAAVFAKDANLFRENAAMAKITIRQQLADLHASGKTVAFWGGTGKGAAFINYYGVDADRFPVVVDSDTDKLGTFVPGTGQAIEFRDHLIDHPAQVLVIPMQWRVRDVLSEIESAGISYETILIEHQGKLIDFHNDPHPY